MSQPTTPNTLRKHKDAVALYHKLSAKTENFNGRKVKIYSETWCIAKAAHAHYLSPSTLESILYKVSV
ncbi:MAG: hypothetical protein JJE55_06955 [Flavobacteriaceae bacterium]|nr:hypothetical protein [Flavobacteriaceae bacterium]